MIEGSPLENRSKYVIKELQDQTSRIVGGEDAPYGSARHMVGLLVGTALKWFTCGGSIITQKHVLTAAHCVEPNIAWGELLPSFHGVVGTHYWNKTDNTEIRFKGYAIHPGWSWITLKNDISVLTTAKQIEFNARVGAISLSTNFVHGRINSFVTGWGNLELFGETPHRLQILRVSTISNKECAIRLWWEENVDGIRAPPFDGALEICTLHSYGHGMCHGDSGSALVDQKTKQQIGIVSWGFPCARGAPDFFVRVSAFIGFIRKSVGIRNL
ncbi:chymotrypsin-1-like [Colias croceus]|uniref:chymotrypsin-1-like n=1 Tax=Colias crocea TaxID=72248 RepID=UPI001E27B185|nr:chymotrypsin-1-like [Colias croceus]